MSFSSSFVHKEPPGTGQQPSPSIEADLIEVMCDRLRWGALVFAGLAALQGLIVGETWEQVAAPLSISLIAFGSTLAKHFGRSNSSRGDSSSKYGVSLILIAMVASVTHRALYLEGCSASIVMPCVYISVLCFSALIYRKKEIILLTGSILLVGIIFVYSQQLQGQCPSEPTKPNDLSHIINHRLLPTFAAIATNCLLLAAVVEESQTSVALHEQTAKKAEQLSELRHNLLHRVTHELRTPLHGIVGSVELLMASQQLCSEDRENTGTIQRCLQSIVGICDNVLLAANASHYEVSKDTSSPMALNDNITTSTINNELTTKRALFSLSQCVDDVIDTYSYSARAKGIELRLEFLGDINVQVRGMENQLVQVLRNLVHNGIKFTDQGHVTLRVKTKEIMKSRALAPARESNGNSGTLSCTFEVQDTGRGINTQDSSLLFEAFQQAEQNAISRTYKGAGLGLTVVRELVQIMGGSIQLESKGVVGEGTVFRIELALKKANNYSSNFEEEDCQAGEVLVVDSQRESRSCCLSVVESIAASHIHVRSVDSTAQLLEYAENVAVDNTGHHRIVILECVEVNKEFQTLLGTLRNNGWSVIAYGNQECHQEICDLGLCSAVFSRPLSLSQLAGTFQKTLSDRPKNGQVVNPDCIETSEVETNAEGSQPLTPKIKSAPFAETTRPSDSSVSICRIGTFEFPPGSKLIVVDDTPFNVKVLSKILSRIVSVPIVSLYSGQSAIDFVDLECNRVDGVSVREPLFFFMDWHMPAIDGLQASEAIQRLCERNNIPVYISIITADIEGLYMELNERRISYCGVVSRGNLTRTRIGRCELQNDDDCTTHSNVLESDASLPLLRENSRSHDDTNSNKSLVLDLVAGKPVTIASVKTMLSYFLDEYGKTTTSCKDNYLRS